MHTDCPLCRANNLLKVPVMAEAEGGYLIPANSMPGNFLIIPEGHIEKLEDLPDDWWKTFKALLPRIPNLPAHYNVSVNLGRHAGQTINHVHFWVIPREGGKPSSGKGFATFIAEADKI